MALPLLAILPAVIAAAGGVTQAAISANVSADNNAQNLALSKEALEAQKAQQTWSNEQYLESRDYTRALQQQIFEREDTALSRATQDAVSAGFSPLTAIGKGLGSGQVVSSPQAPGSMVSNNQASLSNPDLSGLGSSGAIIATIFEGVAKREQESILSEIKLAQEAKEAGLDRLHEEIMQSTEHDFFRSQENQKYYHQLQLALQNEEIQTRLTNLQQSGAENLQYKQHVWQSYLQDDSQRHDIDMAESQRTGTGQRSELINQFIDVVAEGDSRFARWLKENQEFVTVTLQLLSTFIPNN